MPNAVDLVATAIRAASAISPRAGAELALAAFFSTSPRLREHPRDAEVMSRARRTPMIAGGRRMVAYAWGDHGPVVALVHGWKGRTSQFAPLVDPLLESGHRVIAVDLPSHGAAPRARVDVRDWLAAIDELQRRHGRFRAVVGHSFGAFASLTAARHGLETDAVIALAGAGAPSGFLDEFARMTRLDDATRADLERRFLRRLDVGPEAFRERYDALAHPLDAGIPLLLVHGLADRQLPDEGTRRIHEAHPASTMLLLEGVGHARVLADPATRDAVLAHLDRIRAAV